MRSHAGAVTLAGRPSTRNGSAALPSGKPLRSWKNCNEVATLVVAGRATIRQLRHCPYSISTKRDSFKRSRTLCTRLPSCLRTGVPLSNVLPIIARLVGRFRGKVRTGMRAETQGNARETQNPGNEAKKLLKTKEVTKTMCAKRSQFRAQNAANGAEKATFRGKNGTSAGGVRLRASLEKPAPAGGRARNTKSWERS